MSPGSECRRRIARPFHMVFFPALDLDVAQRPISQETQRIQTDGPSIQIPFAALDDHFFYDKLGVIQQHAQHFLACRDVVRKHFKEDIVDRS